MSASARWNDEVSQSTDEALRRLLADDGAAEDVALSRFVEEAVRSRILEIEAARAKQRNAGLTPSEIEAAVKEALEWARRG
jgi:hypothetical protein